MILIGTQFNYIAYFLNIKHIVDLTYWSYTDFDTMMNTLKLFLKWLV